MKRILCILRFVLESIFRGLYRLVEIFVKEFGDALECYIVSCLFVILIIGPLCLAGAIRAPIHISPWHLLIPLAPMFLFCWFMEADHMYYCEPRWVAKRAERGG